MKINEIFIPKKETVLYYNARGTTSNFTLNDSSENYKYIEIFYRTNDNFFGVSKVYLPHGKVVMLNSGLIVGTNTFIFKQARLVVNAKNITIHDNKEIDIFATSLKVYTGNYIYIMRIVGYK